MDAKDFQAKYGKRVTWVETEEGRQSAETIYSEYAAQDGVTPYPVFWTRLKSLERRSSPISLVQIAKAALFDQADWITDYGGGRRKGFTYDGDLYPEHRGNYSAFTSFLKAIGRYGEREMMHSRLKARWAIDDMLSEPPMSAGAPGYIYKITDETTGKAYVGLTVNRAEVRRRGRLLGTTEVRWRRLLPSSSRSGTSATRPIPQVGSHALRNGSMPPPGPSVP